MATEYEIYTAINKDAGKIRESIFCYKCKNESGWNNSDIRNLNKNLTCKICRKICIRYITNASPGIVVKTKEYKHPKHNPIKERNAIEEHIPNLLPQEVNNGILKSI